MSEMIERVARGICKADWGGVSDAEMGRCRDLARAAIIAMREPTKGMVDMSRWTCRDDHMRETWQEMIDAALKENDLG